MKTTIIAASALALAIAFSPGSQAASLIGPDSKVQTDSLTQQVAKKGMHKKRHMRRHAAAGKGPGRCGENMYWSGKHHHCMDARNKA
jgi:hypothetical protein